MKLEPAVIETSVDADNSRSRLVLKAGEIFGDKGFRAATVREICTAAKVNIAAVNYHFGDKENLYVAAVELAGCGAKIAETIEAHASATPEEQLHLFVHGMLSQLLDPARPAWHSQLILRELAHPSHACERIVQSFIRPIADVLSQIVDRLLEKAPVTYDRHLLIFSVVGQCTFHKLNRPFTERLVGRETIDCYTVDMLAEHIANLCLRGLGLNPILKNVSPRPDMKKPNSKLPVVGKQLSLAESTAKTGKQKRGAKS